jgi:hypothetical protein
MVAVVTGALLFWTCVFLVYFTSQNISPVDFFIGGFEPYDPALAKWKVTGSEPGSGHLVEERWLLQDGDARSSYLERQARHRDPATGGIVRVEPTQRVRRRRSRSVRG